MHYVVMAHKAPGKQCQWKVNKEFGCGGWTNSLAMMLPQKLTTHPEVGVSVMVAGITQNSHIREWSHYELLWTSLSTKLWTAMSL